MGRASETLQVLAGLGQVYSKRSLESGLARILLFTHNRNEKSRSLRNSINIISLYSVGRSKNDKTATEGKIVLNYRSGSRDAVTQLIFSFFFYLIRNSSRHTYRVNGIFAFSHRAHAVIIIILSTIEHCHVNA